MSAFEIATAVAFYSLCSSTMLVINKVAIHAIPAPSFVMALQLAASALVVWLLKTFYGLPVDNLSWSKIRPFLGLVILFTLSLFSNAKSLEGANVESVIVFRSCTPIAVALVDYVFRGIALPNFMSLLSLSGVAVGAFVYVATDEGFSIDSYYWLTCYFFVLVTDMVYAKYVCDALPMSTWGRVYYNNLLSVPFEAALGFAFNEQKIFSTFEYEHWKMYALVLSMVAGVGISYAGFHLRNLVSATAFTLVGVLCKLVTVLINLVIWDKHAHGVGISALMVCIASGALYGHFSKAPPKKEDSKKHK